MTAAAIKEIPTREGIQPMPIHTTVVMLEGTLTKRGLTDANLNKKDYRKTGTVRCMAAHCPSAIPRADKCVKQKLKKKRAKRKRKSSVNAWATDSRLHRDDHGRGGAIVGGWPGMITCRRVGRSLKLVFDTVLS